MIYINDIPSFRDPEAFKVIPDDRIEKIPLMGSVTLQDYGHIAAGDAFQLKCMFSEENFEAFLQLWEARAAVTLTTQRGHVFTNLQIVIQEYEYDKDFPENIVVTFELWRKRNG